jgi:hypothetical protein
MEQPKTNGAKAPGGLQHLLQLLFRAVEEFRKRSPIVASKALFWILQPMQVAAPAMI